MFAVLSRVTGARRLLFISVVMTTLLSNNGIVCYVTLKRFTRNADHAPPNPFIPGTGNSRRGRVIFPDDPEYANFATSKKATPVAFERLQQANESYIDHGHEDDHSSAEIQRSQVFFSGPSSTEKILKIRQLIGPCDWAKKEVSFHGKCHRLLQVGTPACGLEAGHHQWLVIDPLTWNPECAAFPCTAGEFLWVDGQCRTLNRLETSEDTEKESVTVTAAGNSCGINERTYFDLHGKSTCDCISGAAFSPLTGSCHLAYTQGPCQPGQVFAPFDHAMACLPNPCSAEGVVPWSAGGCYTLTSRGPCPENEAVSIDPKSLSPTCQPLGQLDIDYDDESQLRAIFRVPSLVQGRSSQSSISADLDDVCEHFGSKNQVQNDMCRALGQQFGFKMHSESNSSGINSNSQDVDPTQCRTGTSKDCPPGYICNPKSRRCIKWLFRP